MLNSEAMKNSPKWLVSTVILLLLALVFYAVIQGRSIDWGIMSIGADDHSNQVAEKFKDDIKNLKLEVSKKKNHIAPDSVINLFPKDVRVKNNIVGTSDLNQEKFTEHKNNLKLLKAENIKLKQEKSQLEGELLDAERQLKVKELTLQEYRGIKESLLFRLIVFHKKSTCYGTTLHFTLGKDRPNCNKKQEIASIFIDLVNEIGVLEIPKEVTQESAVKLVIKLQEKYRLDPSIEKGRYGEWLYKQLVYQINIQA